MAACGGRYWEPHNGFPKHLAVLRGEATQGRSPVDGYPAVLSTNAFPVRLGDLLTPFYPARTAPEVRGPEHGFRGQPECGGSTPPLVPPALRSAR